MKAILILSILASVPFTLANAYDKPYTISSLSGVWENAYRDCSVEIKDYGDAMRVKRQQLFRKWKDFRQVDYNVFSDNDGNIIEIINNSTIIWIERGKRNGEQFFKVGRYGNTFNVIRNNNQRYNQRRYDSRSYDSRRYDSRRSSSRRYDDRRYPNRRPRNPYCG